MDRKQWSAMSPGAKLDYLHDCVQQAYAEIDRISKEVSKAVMRINSRLDVVEKSDKKKSKRR
jgi:hypothetical protein